RKRRNPLRCFPKRWQATWHTSQVTVITGCDSVTMRLFVQLALVVCQGKSALNEQKCRVSCKMLNQGSARSAPLTYRFSCFVLCYRGGALILITFPLLTI